jgi:hypothetical protein
MVGDKAPVQVIKCIDECEYNDEGSSRKLINRLKLVAKCRVCEDKMRE